MNRKTAWKNICARWNHFNERQGFAIVITVCVAVITGTALWTQSDETPYVAPTPPVQQDVSAARLLQESMADVVRVSPAPTVVPTKWLWPTKGQTVVQPWSGQRMVRSATTGVWAVHDGIDLKTAVGEAICAAADGRVVACGQDGIEGAYVIIEHPQEIRATYAGMSMLAALQVGDQVRTGQTIGFGGEGPLSEGQLGPHLHLSITENGKSIDPADWLDKHADTSF